MSRTSENTDQPQDSAFLSDTLLAFECRQAMLRNTFEEPDIDREWAALKRNIPERISVASRQRSQKKRYFLMGTVAGVAAVALILLAIRLYDNYLENRPVTVFLAQQAEVAVTMKTGAQEQILSARKAISDPLPGVRIDSRKADFTQAQAQHSETRTIQTSYGKDYLVVLNDGTQVIMNAGSKLTFPTRFEGTERIVSLEGEAYFKVVKNPERPFVVRTEKLSTRVYGTEFNVRAYKGSDPHVTLIEGVVVVDVPNLKKNIRLLPSEDVSVKNKILEIKDIDPEYYIQWKDGFLYYDNVSLREVLSDIGRWYNVDIEIGKSSLMAYRMHFVVNRNAGIEEVVENLNEFKFLRASKIGNKISIDDKKNS
jgi:ferric-dicitrate binding protein FerR (iron transport regulator)